jgi:hypothetical protein
MFSTLLLAQTGFDIQAKHREYAFTVCEEFQQVAVRA